MEPVICVTDIHLGQKRDSKVWHDVTLKLFRDIATTAIKRNIKKIFILGDFFDNRQFINIKTLEVAFEIAEILSDFEVYIIAGNHDIHFRNTATPNSLTIFKEGYQHITIIDEEPLQVEDITLIPWLFDNLKSINTPHIFGHFDICAFKMNECMECEEGRYTARDFKKFTSVLSGHFHMPSTKGNITYLGSPYQMDFGDAGSQRGYYIFEDGNLEFVEFKEYPHYVLLYTNNLITSEMVEGNIVKIVFTEEMSSNNTTSLLERIQLAKPMQLFTDFKGVNFKIENSEEETEIVEVKLKSNMEIFNDYLDKIEIPSHINKTILKKIVQSLHDNKQKESE